MSNWLSEYTSDEQQQVDELNAQGIRHKPTQQKSEPGAFSGAISAPLRGVQAGLYKTLDTVGKPLQAVADRLEYTYKDLSTDQIIEPYDEFKAEKTKDRTGFLVGAVEYLEDKENTGVIGNIAFSLGDYATRAALGSFAGPVGAAALSGASETNYNYQSLTEQGVDSDTAMQVASIDGAIAAVGTFLPASYGFKGTGGIAKDAVVSIGGASVLSSGGQALSGEILQSEGYDKQAKKYEVSGESVATDVLLNTLTFGVGRYMQGRLSNDIDAELDSIDSIEAQQTQKQGALVLNEMELEDISAPVKPADAIQHNNHLKNLNQATQQIKSGQPVNVNAPVKGEAKTQPITASKVASYTAKPWAKTIAFEAEKRGINPVDALVISHIETGGTFDPKIQPKNRDGKLLSSATGLFQTLDGTFARMGGKSKFDGDDQIKAGLNYYEYNSNIFLKQFGRKPTGLEVYYMHFFGEGGGPVFLKAKDSELFVDVATRWSKGGKKKTARQVAEGITRSHQFDGMTVGEVKAKYQKRWNDVAKQYGGDGSAVQTAGAMNGAVYDVAYDVKSLDDLIASNDRLYQTNPNYPAELQPRDRSRAASQQQIEDMANNLRPELLGESYKISDGAPIIGPDNVVESGNGRTLAIGKAYEKGNAAEYQKFVEQYAAERGLDITGINNPVLVRTRLTDTDRVEFARLANESDVAQFSVTERALTDTDRLPDASLLKINNDGTFNLDGSMDYVRGFVDQLPKSERASAVTADGRLSQEGKRRIESAIAQRAYGDSSLVTRLSENLDDDSKTVLNALLRSAPQLAQLDDLVKQGGRTANTIAADLAQAAQKLSDLKANGLKVQDYLNQGQLIDDGLSPGAREFLNVFDQNSRSAKAISENIQGKINDIEAMGDPRQGSLFGGSPEENAALDIVMQNPDQQISVSRIRPDGEVEEITMTLRERLDELEAEARQAQQDTTAIQAAISCALQFGE